MEKADPNGEQPESLHERVRESVRIFAAYLTQPEAERAAGAESLLASTRRAHDEFVRLTNHAVQALPSEQEHDRNGDQLTPAAALAATRDIAHQAGLQDPDAVAAQIKNRGKNDAWIADTSARYSAFIVAALTAQGALLDGLIDPARYAEMLLATARELADAS